MNPHVSQRTYILRCHLSEDIEENKKSQTEHEMDTCQVTVTCNITVLTSVVT
jgi:hypothetical protein